MIWIYLITTFLIIDFFYNNNLNFAFSLVNENGNKQRSKIDLKNIFQSISLEVAFAALPLVAGKVGGAAGGAAGGGAAGGGGGLMGKLGGMMGKGGGGSGGGGGSNMAGNIIGAVNGVGGKIAGMTKGLTQATFSAALGGIQSIKAAALKKKADAAMPELVDPNQAGFLAELGQKRKSIDTGADFAAGMQAIDATNAGTNNALVQNSGGDVSGTIQSLLQSERVANDSKNQVLAQGQQQQMQYNSMYSNQLNDIAQRKLEIQLLRSQQKRAEWAKMKSNASSNFMAAGSGLGNMFKDAGKPLGDFKPNESSKPSMPEESPAPLGKTLGVAPPDNKLSPKARQDVFSGSSTAAGNSLPKAAQQSVFGSQGTSADPNILANVIKGFKK